MEYEIKVNYNLSKVLIAVLITSSFTDDLYLEIEISHDCANWHNCLFSPKCNVILSKFTRKWKGYKVIKKVKLIENDISENKVVKVVKNYGLHEIIK